MLHNRALRTVHASYVVPMRYLLVETVKLRRWNDILGLVISRLLPPCFAVPVRSAIEIYMELPNELSLVFIPLNSFT